jgi:hypothetical protein
MPLPGNGTRAGSVPLDALDAEEIADLLGCAAAALGALAGDPAAEEACAGLAGGTPTRPCLRGQSHGPIT